MGGITVHVIGNKELTKMAVVSEGDTIFEGDSMNARDLFKLLEGTYGAIEYLKYHEVTDEELENPLKIIYGDD